MASPFPSVATTSKGAFAVIRSGSSRGSVLGSVCLGAGIIASTAARADIQFNGFGQTIVGSTLADNRPMPNRISNTVDYTADPNFRSESLFALQVQAGLSEKIYATAQLLADGAPNGLNGSGGYTNDEFTPKFTWAYVNWIVSDNWSIKGGRQASPLYHYSDYLHVGEAYSWIRPPVSVYSSPVNSFDGVSLNGTYSVGRWYLQPELYYGNYSGGVFNQANSANVRLSNYAGAVLDVSYNEWLELRASYAWAKLTTTFDQQTQLQSALQQYASIAETGYPPGCTFTGNPAACIPADTTGLAAPAYLAASNQLAVNDQTIQYYSAGFEANKANFTLSGEYIWQRSPSFLAQSIGYYTSLAYHLGPFTPVLVYGRAEGKIGDKGVGQRLISDVKAGDNTETGTILESVTQAQTGTTLLEGMNILVATQRTIDDYYEIGFRYDVSRNTALKLDYTYYNSPLETAQNPGQGFQHAQLLSAGFVFAF